MSTFLKISGRKIFVSQRRASYMRMMKNRAEFSILDVSMCLRADPSEMTKEEIAFVCKNAQLRKLSKNPLRTLHLYQSEMEACHKHGNGESHYIEGVKQYFALQNPRLGLKHMENSAKNHSAKGNYLLAILLLVTGDYEEGMRRMELDNWRNDMSGVDTLWRQIKRSLRDIPVLRKRVYGTNMILIFPPRACKPDVSGSRCPECFIYKKMKKFLQLIHHD